MKKQPHYLGHRSRVRKKFLTSLAFGSELHDYELLEILLFAAFTRKDTKILAKNLIAKFGDISAVINADISRLKEVEGVGEAALAQIKLVAQISRRILKNHTKENPVLKNWQAVLNYANSLLKDLPNEAFHVLFLDQKYQLIEDKLLAVGENNHVAISVKEVARSALMLHASAVILLHNHPSDNLKPSKSDIQITNEITAVLKKFEIEVVDHVIIGKSGYFSFRENGLG